MVVTAGLPKTKEEAIQGLTGALRHGAVVSSESTLHTLAFGITRVEIIQGLLSDSRPSLHITARTASQIQLTPEEAEQFKPQIIEMLKKEIFEGGLGTSQLARRAFHLTDEEFKPLAFEGLASRISGALPECFHRLDDGVSAFGFTEAEQKAILFRGIAVALSQNKLNTPIYAVIDYKLTPEETEQFRPDVVRVIGLYLSNPTDSHDKYEAKDAAVRFNLTASDTEQFKPKVAEIVRELRAGEHPNLANGFIAAFHLSEQDLR